MNEQERTRKIQKIAEYATKVNGFKPFPYHFNYWQSLDDYQLTQVYNKWQALYSAVVFSLPDDFGKTE